MPDEILFDPKDVMVAPAAEELMFDPSEVTMIPPAKTGKAGRVPILLPEQEPIQPANKAFQQAFPGERGGIVGRAPMLRAQPREEKTVPEQVAGELADVLPGPFRYVQGPLIRGAGWIAGGPERGIPRMGEAIGDVGTAQTGPERAAAGTAFLRGATETALPLVAYGAVVAPIATVLSLTAGAVAHKATEAGGTALHLRPEYTQFASEFAGIAAALGAFKITEGINDFWQGIEEHNARASTLVDAERTAGEQSEKFTQVFNEPIPTQIGGRPHTIEYAGSEARTGRPIFRVVDDSTGDAIYAGRGKSVQDFLRIRGARPAEPVPAQTAGEPSPTSTEAPPSTVTKAPENVEEAEWEPLPPEPAGGTAAKPEVPAPKPTKAAKPAKPAVQAPEAAPVAPAKPAEPVEVEPSDVSPAPLRVEQAVLDQTAQWIEGIKQRGNVVPATTIAKAHGIPVANAIALLDKAGLDQYGRPKPVDIETRKPAPAEAPALTPEEEIAALQRIGASTNAAIRQEQMVAQAKGETGEPAPETVRKGLEQIGAEAAPAPAAPAKEPWQTTREEYVRAVQGNWQDELQHQNEVTLAVREGKPVSPEVLVDYPDLKPKARVLEFPAPPPPTVADDYREDLRLQAIVADADLGHLRTLAEKFSDPDLESSDENAITQQLLDAIKANPELSQAVDRATAARGDQPDEWRPEDVVTAAKMLRESAYAELAKNQPEVFPGEVTLDPADVQQIPVMPQPVGGRIKTPAEETPNAPASTETAPVQQRPGTENRPPLGDQLPTAGGGTETSRPVLPQRRGGGGARRGGARTVERERPELAGGTRTGGGGVEGTAGGPRPEGEAPARPTDTNSRKFERDYRIPNERVIGGSPETRARNNIEAIRLLRNIQTDNRPATVDEQAKLASYTGWGAAPQLFAGRDENFRKLQNELRSILTPEEYAAAEDSTPNAHYTSDTVVDAMWGAMVRLGAKPGMSWLEPAVGVGNFFGRQPVKLLAGARRVGIEKEPITGQIAQALYPDSGIQVVGYEDSGLPENYFDAAISNVPFGRNVPVYDPSFRRQKYLTANLHDYFFAKALTNLRPGGVLAFITSRNTMDDRSGTGVAVRQWLANQADFLGAVRLPGGAFQKSAGTEVVTDVIFLRKRLPGAEVAGEKWAATKPRKVGENWNPTIFHTNEYFHEHPEMVLGKEAPTGTMYAARSYNVEGTVTPEVLKEAFDRLPRGAFQGVAATTPKSKTIRLAELQSRAATGAKLGALFFDDSGKLFQRTAKGSAEPVEYSKEAVAKVRGQLAIRDAVRRLLDAELQDAPEPQINDLRRNLNALYDRYVSKNGPLSARSSMSVMEGDPDAPVLQALERRFDPRAKTAEKAPIFSERQLRPARAVEATENPADALSVVLNELGRVDWDRMGKLTGLPAEQLQESLRGMVYLDPTSNTWQTADEYLSGSVRAKLREARAHAKLDPRFQENVTALEAVQPEDILPGRISAILGAPWVPIDTYRMLAADVLGSRDVPEVQYVGGEWFVPWAYGQSKWATARVSAGDLLKDCLNARRTTVYDRQQDGTSVLNQQETLAARQRQSKLQDYFQQWLFADADRTTQMVRAFNDTHNDIRRRRFDGNHLTLPGMSRTGLRGDNLDPHQLAAVWRQICQPNVLLAHCVGAGKTAEMIAGAMELKRLGLIKRPMFVVPNATLSTWSDQWAALYPQARVIVFSEKDLEKSNRRAAMARIAAGDWDAVVIPHSSFQKIPTGEETFREHYNKLANELQQDIVEAEAGGIDTRLVKRMAKARERLLESLLDRRAVDSQDQTVSWEQLGIDHLVVDEAHTYKRLGFSTKQANLAGIDSEGNQKTFDLLMKSRYTQKHGRGVVFATGTPVTNTMGELFTMMRYLIEPELQARGIGRFDEWAANYGRTIDIFEPKPEGGGYRIKARFARFVNLRSLSQLFSAFADVVTPDQIKLPVPKIQGGTRRVIESFLTPEQVEYMETLRARGEAIRVNPREALPDNMLALYTDALKMALDIHMVRPGAPEDAGSRLNQAAEEIHQVWTETAEQRGVQLVFSDYGKPAEAGGSTVFSLYDALIDKLVKAGIPRNEIAHIYQAKNKPGRDRLFRDVNEGRIRVLIGSSEKMGVGVNVQKRVVALHHLDCPHRPADLEQREGRAMRQGNDNPEVALVYYLTRGSLDELRFGNVARKGKFINEFLRGETDVDEIEDVDEMVPSLQLFQAMASGDPRVMRKLEVDTELQRLGAIRSALGNERYEQRQTLQQLPAIIDSAEKKMASDQVAIARREKLGRVWEVGGKTWQGEGIGKDVAAVIGNTEWFKTPTDKQVDKLGIEPTLLARAYGADLWVDCFKTYAYVGTPRYPEGTIYIQGAPALGIVQRVENHYKGLEEGVVRNRTLIEQSRKQQAELTEAVAKPWAQQAEYDKLLTEQAELTAALGGVKDEEGAGTAVAEGEEIPDARMEAQDLPEEEEVESESAQKLNPEAGALPMLSDLAGWMQRRFVGDAPRANYSELGALRATYRPGGGLSQTEMANSAVFEAGIRAASYRSQISVILRAAVPAIERALEGSEFTWDELRLALVESRLRGARQRWEDFAAQAREMTDDELAGSFTEHFATLLGFIEDKAGLPEDLAETAAAMLERAEAHPRLRAKTLEQLRGFLERTFDQAAASVNTAMDADWFDAVTGDPQVQQALVLYKKLVEAPMAREHALNEGVFSDALGPLDTYYPLIPVNRPTPHPPGRMLPYRKPRNAQNAFATGLSQQYDATIEAFRDRLEKAARGNNKAALLQVMEDEGFLQPDVGQETFVDPEGREFAAQRVEVAPAKLIIRDKKLARVPAKTAVTAKWMANEVRDILEPDRRGNRTAVDAILRVANLIPLKGPADFVFHMRNIYGTITALTPFLDTTLKGKALSIPLLKKFTAMGYAMFGEMADPTTPENIEQLSRMAEVGVIPQRWASVTYSKKYAEQTGAERQRFSMGPLIYGPEALDIRARLFMWNLGRKINPNWTVQEAYHWVNQLGNYTHALQGSIEKRLKRGEAGTGWGPFATAGMTMIVNGVNAWTGAGAMPKGGAGLRVWQQLTGGAIVMLAAWVLIYHAYTGRYPWNDKRAKLLKIPLNESDRHSKLARAIWGHKGVAYLDFAFFDPLVMRGARAMGIPGFVETRLQHGSFGQQLDAVQRDILNALVHPAAGPAVRSSVVLGFGIKPYLLDYYDARGRISPTLMPAIPPRTKAGLPVLGKRAAAALLELNATADSAAEAMGLAGPYSGQHGEPNRWLRMILDYTFPGAIANASNPSRRQQILYQQRQGQRSRR